MANFDTLLKALRNKNSKTRRNAIVLLSPSLRHSFALNGRLGANEMSSPSIVSLYEPDILDFLKDETAGDPQTKKTWIRRSLRNIQSILDIRISIGTI